ncbi:hypothetical protein JHK85_006826 [Glycine max]|nr:hypothetical protein JHK85_006826 [Glycine max]
MAQHATRHNSAVCWFYCRDETNDVRPDAVRGALILLLLLFHFACVNKVQQKMNDLVYVMYNSKLESKKNRKTIALPLDEIEFDDEWITEKGYNDEDEQPRGEGDGGNVELVGDVRGSSNDLVVDAFDLDNLILVEPYDDAQSEEDLDDDGEGDESADIHGDDPIRGLDMVL